MHVYSVDLLISGDKLHETALAPLLLLRKGQFREKGDPLVPGAQRTASTSTCLFPFDPPNLLDGKPLWRSLDEGLVNLAKELQPARAILHDLGKEFSVDAYCGYFGSGFGGGPSISLATLQKIADLGLGLTIKTYPESMSK